MKHLISATVFLLLLSCKSEKEITPDKLISIEYGVLFGFGGSVSKITIFPQKQVFQPSYTSSKTCEASVSASEWKELTGLFDEGAFKKTKVGPESDCADASSAWITARSSNGEIKAIWGSCTGGDPTGILPLINVLDERMAAMRSTCK